MIYTGYFAKTKEYEEQGLVPVAIAGKVPEWFDGARYPLLAPKYAWWKEWHDNKLSNQQFIEKYYETVLNTLNPTVVLEDLQRFGKDIVLLCYETPEKFCHRHLVAEWLNKNLNLNVYEYVSEEELEAKINEMFDDILVGVPEEKRDEAIDILIYGETDEDFEKIEKMREPLKQKS